MDLNPALRLMSETASAALEHLNDDNVVCWQKEKVGEGPSWGPMYLSLMADSISPPHL